MRGLTFKSEPSLEHHGLYLKSSKDIGNWFNHQLDLLVSQNVILLHFSFAFCSVKVDRIMAERKGNSVKVDREDKRGLTGLQKESHSNGCFRQFTA